MKCHYLTLVKTSHHSSDDSPTAVSLV